MCGIAGWVEYGRDLAREETVVRAMTDALASRGVDDRGLWLGDHAGLGHTRTAVIDPAGGRQPMVARENGEDVAVLVYSGEIFNYRQLRTELRGHGHEFATASDTEVVLRAYQQWGEHCAQRLEGMFAFAVWDVRRQELLLVRDRLGIKPVYYTRAGDGLLFGSEPKALLAHPGTRPVVDLDGLRDVFATAREPGRAVFRDMRELRPGTSVTVSRTGLRERVYWRLAARPHEQDLAGTVRHVRELLEEIVLRELRADVPLCTALSGGIDSGAVTALAARWLWRLEGRRVRTVTTTFRGHQDHFRPDEIRGTEDEPFARQVAAHLDAEHRMLVLDTQDLLSPEHRATVLRAQDKPNTVGDMAVSHYLMLKAIRGHATVVLTGEGGDEIFGGHRWMHDPAFTHADTFPWVANEHSMPGSRTGHGRGLFDAGLFLRKLDMDTYYADLYRQTLAEAPHTDGESAHERRMRDICYAHIARWMPVLLERGDRIAMAHGLETRVPLLDHRLVEYLYNTPWSLKCFDGQDKSLLRAAVADLLPPAVLARPKAPWPVTADPAYTRALHAELREVLADASSPVLPLLDLAAARQAPAAADWPSRVNVETVLQFNAWLREYRVELVL